MDVQICGCKGIRTCLHCEKIKGIKPKYNIEEFKKSSFIYCTYCNVGHRGWDWNDQDNQHELHPSEGLANTLYVDGIWAQDEFLTEEEESHLLDHINRLPWCKSQSGRRKQDFGPKVNFKKRKIRTDVFEGFPEFVQFLLHRFCNTEGLRDFRPVELCHLQYDPARGSTIDPHLDDTWLWGERLVTVNVGSPTVLTLTQGTTALRIPLKSRSILVLSKEARYQWEHCIFRDDVRGVRIALTFRELAEEFLQGGAGEATGQELLQKARQIIHYS